MNKKEIFRKRLVEIRKKLGLSQGKFAQILNTSQSTVCQYEKGDIEPSLETLSKIADIGNTTVDCLLGREDFIPREGIRLPSDFCKIIREIANFIDKNKESNILLVSDKYEKNLVELVRNLNEEDKKELLNFCHFKISNINQV